MSVPKSALPLMARSLCLTSDAHVQRERGRLRRVLKAFDPLTGRMTWCSYGAGLLLPLLLGPTETTPLVVVANLSGVALMAVLATRATHRELAWLSPAKAALPLPPGASEPLVRFMSRVKTLRGEMLRVDEAAWRLLQGLPAEASNT